MFITNKSIDSINELLKTQPELFSKLNNDLNTPAMDQSLSACMESLKETDFYTELVSSQPDESVQDNALAMTAYSIALESCVNERCNVGASAIVNIGMAAGDSFSSVWYPTSVRLGNEQFLDLAVNVHKLYQSTARTTDGSVVELDKTSVIKAIVDSSLLQNRVNAIILQATSATLPSVLVSQAVVPDTVVSAMGNDYNTRPLLFDQSVDLLSVSPRLDSSGDSYTELDTLDPVINIGTVYLELKVTTGIGSAPVSTTVVIAVDLSDQIHSYFTQSLNGSVDSYLLNIGAIISVSHTTAVVSGDQAAIITAIETMLGIAVGDKFLLSSTLELSGTVDRRTAIMEVFDNGLDIDTVSGADAVLSLALLDTGTELLELTPLGYSPKAYRKLDHLYPEGTFVDIDDPVTFRYPITAAAPFIVKGSITGLPGRTVAQLSMVNGLRVVNNSVQALDRLEQMLRMNNGNQIRNVSIGAELVVPTLIEPSPIDISTVINTLDVPKALLNVRETLVAVLTNAANELLERSEYLAAIEAVVGDPDGFEFITVSDPTIASHLMVSGEDRTIGGNRKVIITQSSNSFFQGKIYLSMRRTDRAEPSGLDFGVNVMSPALIKETIRTGGEDGTTAVMHYEPRNDSYAVLPLLAVITVTNMDSLYNI